MHTYTHQQELVDQDILQLPPRVNIKDFVGHYKNLDAIESKALEPTIPEPSVCMYVYVCVCVYAYV